MTSATPTVLPPTGCVGRERELTELAGLLTAAVRGAAVVTVVGEPGIGKTALLRQLVTQHGGRWARAVPWESELPGGVLAQLLQDDVPADPVAAAAVLVDRLQGTGPQVLVIDDAEHADIESLQAISTAVRHQRELPLLVVLGTAERAGDLGDLASREIRLTGLPPDGVADLARRRGATLHPAMVAALTRHTRGNPRDVLALLDEVPTAVWSRPDTDLPAPAHVVEHVGAQLQRCGPDGRALIEAVAILGDAPLAEAAALAGITDPVAAIDDAAAAGLLATAPEDRKSVV